MYICLCKGITDKQIKKELEGKNPGQFKEVCSKLGVGSDCGTCMLRSEELLNEVSAAYQKSKPAKFNI